MANLPAPREGIVLTHFVVSDDIPSSRRFCTEALGGEAVREGEPSVVALATGDQTRSNHPRPPRRRFAVRSLVREVTLDLWRS